MTKHIFVTGGVVSSLGKGLTAASLGNLLTALAGILATELGFVTVFVHFNYLELEPKFRIRFKWLQNL